MEELILQAIGEASGCWSDIDKAGVFDSARASAIGKQLLQDIELLNEKKFDIEQKMQDIYANCEDASIKLDILMSLHSLRIALGKGKDN